MIHECNINKIKKITIQKKKIKIHRQWYWQGWHKTGLTTLFSPGSTTQRDLLSQNPLPIGIQKYIHIFIHMRHRDIFIYTKTYKQTRTKTGKKKKTLKRHSIESSEIGSGLNFPTIAKKAMILRICRKSKIQIPKIQKIQKIKSKINMTTYYRIGGLVIHTKCCWKYCNLT